jgi:hypothetical protein
MPGHLADHQLEQIREQRRAALGSWCEVRRARRGEDGHGTVREWSETVVCSVVTPTTKAAAHGGMVPVVGDEPAATIVLPWGTVLAAADEIHCDGVVYEVVRVDGPGAYGVQVTAYGLPRPPATEIAQEAP